MTEPKTCPVHEFDLPCLMCDWLADVYEDPGESPVTGFVPTDEDYDIAIRTGEDLPDV